MSISVEQLCALVTAGFTKQEITSLTAQEIAINQNTSIQSTESEPTQINPTSDNAPDDVTETLRAMQNSILQLSNTVQDMQRHNVNRDISNGAKAETVDDINKFLLGYKAPEGGK